MRRFIQQILTIPFFLLFLPMLCLSLSFSPVFRFQMQYLSSASKCSSDHQYIASRFSVPSSSLTSWFIKTMLPPDVMICNLSHQRPFLYTNRCAIPNYLLICAQTNKQKPNLFHLITESFTESFTESAQGALIDTAHSTPEKKVLSYT